MSGNPPEITCRVAHADVAVALELIRRLHDRRSAEFESPPGQAKESAGTWTWGAI